MANDDEWLDDEDQESEPDEADAEAAADAVLTFIVGGRLFGLAIAQVGEIVAVPERTPLPEAPPWLTGVATLRGRIVPLVDLRQRLGLAASDQGARPCVVVTEGSAFPIGLVLDEVRDVVTVPAEHRSPPPLRAGRGFVAALGRVGESVAILLDPERLLDASEQHELSAALLAEVAAAEAPPRERTASAPAAPVMPAAPARPSPRAQERHERPGSGPHAG